MEKLTDLEIAQKYINKARNADAKGQEFALSMREFTVLMRKQKCYYTGVVLQSENLQYPNGRTLDRIDSSKGYVTGNVVVCSFYFNQLKGVFEDTNSEFTLRNVMRGLKKL